MLTDGDSGNKMAENGLLLTDGDSGNKMAENGLLLTERDSGKKRGQRLICKGITNIGCGKRLLKHDEQSFAKTK